MRFNEVHSVNTDDRFAAELVETSDRLHELAFGKELEAGVIWVYSTADVGVLAFTPFGIENLIKMIAMKRDRRPEIATAFNGWMPLRCDLHRQKARDIDRLGVCKSQIVQSE